MLGDKIRALRKEHRLTIEQLALNLDSNYSTFGMYETNKRKPDYAMLCKIANFFNVSVDELIDSDFGKNETPVDIKIILKEIEQMTPNQRKLALGIIKQIRKTEE